MKNSIIQIRFFILSAILLYTALTKAHSTKDSLKQKYPLVFNENIIWAGTLENFVFIKDSSILAQSNIIYKNDSAFVEILEFGHETSKFYYFEEALLAELKTREALYAEKTKSIYQEHNGKKLKGSEIGFSDFLYKSALSANSDVFESGNEENGYTGVKLTLPYIDTALNYYFDAPDFSKFDSTGDFFNVTKVIKSEIVALKCPMELYFNSATNEIISKVKCIMPAEKRVNISDDDFASFRLLLSMAVNNEPAQKNNKMDINDPDIIWAKRTKKFYCLPSLYFNESLNPDVSEIKKLFNKTIIDILFEKVRAGEMIAYNPDGKAIIDIHKYLSQTDTFQIENTEPDKNGEFGTHIETRTYHLDSKDFFHFYLLQDWFFNKKTMKMETNILGIAPVEKEVDSSGTFLKDFSELFWVYFNGYKP